MVEGVWSDLLASVERRRSPDAPYFKPACLIAVIDLIECGEIDPTNIDADRVLARFDAYVSPWHRGRPDMRWRPLWHLSNDGAWQFSRQGRIVGPADFEPARKPDSLPEWKRSFDKIATPVATTPYWQSSEHRVVLRQAALAMLSADNDVCRALAAVLAGVRVAEAPTNVPDVQLRPGQGFQPDQRLSFAIEMRAMEVVRQWLEAERWDVADCSKTSSFDFFARRGEEVLFVEVKGTMGAGQTIQLTRAEVEFSQAHRDHMALVVVSGIAISEQEGAVVGRGGLLTVRRPWAPDASSLTPISFTCVLD